MRKKKTETTLGTIVEKGVNRERRQFSATETYNEVTGGERKSCDKESMDHRCLTTKTAVRSKLKADRPRASGSTPR